MNNFSILQSSKMAVKCGLWRFWKPKVKPNFGCHNNIPCTWVSVSSETLVYERDVTWITDYDKICFHTVRQNLSYANFKLWPTFCLVTWSLTSCVQHITCTTRHPNLYSRKVVFVWHQLFIVKSSRQTSWQTEVIAITTCASLCLCVLNVHWYLKLTQPIWHQSVDYFIWASVPTIIG